MEPHTTVHTHTTSPSFSSEEISFGDVWQSFVATFYSSDDVLAPVMRYILEAPGKRVRANACLLAFRFCATSQPALRRPLAMRGALALEMVHAYSLVHDDLPCMDDDTMRRGRKTAHIEFDEARALLAGDGLLTDAFNILTDNLDDSFSGAEAIACRMVAELTRAAGSRGMVWGQALDLHWTGRPGATISDLMEIHSTKTGCLLGASFALGALAAGATESVVEQMRMVGRYVGLAFQIIDDLIDLSPTTGKTPGKDESEGKITYVSVLGRDKARTIAEELTGSASRILKELEPAEGASCELNIFISKLLIREK